MKTQFLTFATTILFLFSSATFIGCGGGSDYDQHDHENHEHVEDQNHDNHESDGDMQPEAVYQCPIKCEGDKTYPKPGACPVCGMDIKKLEMGKDEHEEGAGHSDHDHDGHDHNQ